MITLTLIMCALSAPSDCTSITLEVPSMHECSGIGGQASAARWLSDHKGYAFRGWRCSYGKRTDA